MPVSRRGFLRGAGAGLFVSSGVLGLGGELRRETSVDAMSKPLSADSLIYASATTLAEAIRSKKVSSEEVVKAYLERIEAVNPKINAVVQLAEDALAQAREADTDLAKGKIRGPLHGVPVTIKDSLATSDMITTSGTKGRAAFVPDGDATVVARFRGAGAIILAKTNVPELCISFETDNLVYDRTNNPYDLRRTPGGSSGGEAAIIAAGGSPLGIGSDTGGSIRLPAHFCGVAGLKPSSGRVPRTGHFPPSDGIYNQLWQVGPMARYVDDLILALPVIAGPDWNDSAAVPMPMGDPKQVDLKRLRVAFHVDNGIMRPTQETIVTIEKAARSLSDAGLAVHERRPPGIERTLEFFIGLSTADGGEWLQNLLETAGTEDPHPVIQLAMTTQRAGAKSAAELGNLLIALDAFRSKMLTFMKGYDLILCPACAFPALPHGGSIVPSLMPGFSYPMTFNLTGWPVAVVRAGTSPEGMPIGVQIAARPWRDDVALAAAKLIETAMGGWKAPDI